MASLRPLSTATPAIIRRLASPSLPRFFSTTFIRRGTDDKKPNFFGSGPAPPRLPKEEQEIFEKLQRQSTGAFSTPRVNQPGDSQSPQPDTAAATAAQEKIPEQTDGVYPDIRNYGLKPEFEGDKNPKTGEIGGPKNEPLRWGANGDWSFGGRVTDF
ncbi:hypothetical protein VTN49DRAFT_3547 [Thermomyces lanuginosus]|uniref:uncharacterized protein n=1 Tax=Thermomyces lanuginosus TaxID=5541 RepID=UPI0037433010